MDAEEDEKVAELGHAQELLVRVFVVPVHHGAHNRARIDAHGRGEVLGDSRSFLAARRVIVDVVSLVGGAGCRGLLQLCDQLADALLLLIAEALLQRVVLTV